MSRSRARRSGHGRVDDQNEANEEAIRSHILPEPSWLVPQNTAFMSVSQVHGRIVLHAQWRERRRRKRLRAAFFFRPPGSRPMRTTCG